MKALIDENLSPSLVERLGEIGIAAVHVVHVGKSGVDDAALWQYALEQARVVITINASDFVKLAEGSGIHAGLVVLRSQGLSRAEQWAWIKPVFEAVIGSGEDLLNRVVEVTSTGKFTVRAIPPT